MKAIVSMAAVCAAALAPTLGCGSDDEDAAATTEGVCGTGGALDVGAGGSCAPTPAPPCGAECPAECTGGCTESGICTIQCGAGECNDGQITCPPGFSCNVVCAGVDACDTSTVQCPAAYACLLTCAAGVDTCGDVKLACTDGPCAVECAADGAPCTGMTVQCGSGACTATCAGDSKPDGVDCGASCSCTTCP